MASRQFWDQGMAASLAERTGWRFELISDLNALTAERLAAVNPKYIFFPHWSHHIDANIYQSFDCIIFHMTDLPFGRGGSPLQNLIIRGIYETKISALKCVEEMDAGPIYIKQPLSLQGSAEEIYLRASKVIEEMIIEILDKQPIPVSQQGKSTIFRRCTPAQGDLIKAESLQGVFDLIRMLDAEGYPHAFVDLGPFRLEFTRASRKTDHVLADVRITMIKKVD